MFDDPDGYWEIEGPEVSGPVALMSVGVSRPLQVDFLSPQEEWFASEAEFLRPFPVGPPQ